MRSTAILCLEQVARIRGREAAAAGGDASASDPAGDLDLDFSQPEPENLDEVMPRKRMVAG